MSMVPRQVGKRQAEARSHIYDGSWVANEAQLTCSLVRFGTAFSPV